MYIPVGVSSARDCFLLVLVRLECWVLACYLRLSSGAPTGVSVSLLSDPGQVTGSHRFFATSVASRAVFSTIFQLDVWSSRTPDGVFGFTLLRSTRVDEL